MRLIRAGSGKVDEADALRAMFVARREVFVDLLGWDVPVIAGHFELDRFDDPHARYVILVDETGRHRASARLLPTERPHLLDSFYPDLCDGEIPRGPCTFEITRFCLDRHQSAHERRAARDRLVSELAITAIVSGIRCYTGVAETPWFHQILGFGWRCRALGAPRVHGRHELSGLRIDIDEHTMDRLAANGIYDPQRDEPAAALARVAA
jgi:N-acyl-L-homoserine lactone synthetase